MYGIADAEEIRPGRATRRRGVDVAGEAREASGADDRLSCRQPVRTAEGGAPVAQSSKPPSTSRRRPAPPGARSDEPPTVAMLGRMGPIRRRPPSTISTRCAAGITTRPPTRGWCGNHFSQSQFRSAASPTAVIARTSGPCSTANWHTSARTSRARRVRGSRRPRPADGSQQVDGDRQSAAPSTGRRPDGPKRTCGHRVRRLRPSAAPEPPAEVDRGRAPIPTRTTQKSPSPGRRSHIRAPPTRGPRRGRMGVTPVQ